MPRHIVKDFIMIDDNSPQTAFVQELRKNGALGADLSWRDLRDADLSGVELRAANMYGAILHNANLTNADLRNVDLAVAELNGAILTGARLSGTRLEGTGLRWASCGVESVGRLSIVEIDGEDTYHTFEFSGTEDEFLEFAAKQENSEGWFNLLEIAQDLYDLS